MTWINIASRIAVDSAHLTRGDPHGRDVRCRASRNSGCLPTRPKRAAHDRPVDVITAVLTNLRCCLRNPAPLLLWAGLILGLTGVGFASLMLGLVIVLPWLAHASWHAYRDLAAD
jgi:hypothetical protein